MTPRGTPALGGWALSGLTLVVALGLTVLFFHKYNYWLLVVFALMAAELTAQ